MDLQNVFLLLQTPVFLRCATSYSKLLDEASSMWLTRIEKCICQRFNSGFPQVQVSPNNFRWSTIPEKQIIINMSSTLTLYIEI